MLALPDTQACLMNALLQRSDGAGAVALLRPVAVPTAQQRLQIYRNNLFESLTAALSSVYPVVAHRVGLESFRHAAAVYIRAHPSRSGNLHDFGAEMPEFLRAYRPAACLPYLPDMAALEWAYHRATHEAELPALALDRVTQVPPADRAEMRFHLQPSARLVAASYPVLKIWQANQPQAPECETAISLHDGGVNLLVVQHNLEIEFRLLGGTERRWLCALAEGARLAEATHDALDDDPAFDAATILAHHIERGLFTDILLPPRFRKRLT
jgi:hypothetical protein